MNNWGKKISALRKVNNLTQEELADLLGVERVTISAYESGRIAPSIQVFISLAKIFSVTIDELAIPDSPKADAQAKENHAFKLEEPFEEIILVAQKAQAGYTSGYSDTEYLSSFPTLSIPKHLLPRKSGYRVFEIIGESMPPLTSGDLVIGSRETDLKDMKEGIYAIVVTRSDGILYKRLYKSEKKKILLVSDNPRFAPYLIDPSEILEVWPFVAKVGFGAP